LTATSYIKARLFTRHYAKLVVLVCVHISRGKADNNPLLKVLFAAAADI
jgi:hypothetical protein